MTIDVLVQTSHQHSIRSTLKNLFCFTIFNGYLLSGRFSMYTANSLLDPKWCGILPALFASRR